MREARRLANDPLLLSKVLIIKENGKENKIRGVHGKTELPVGILNNTNTVEKELIDSHRDNNSYTTDHLQDLNGGDKRSELEDGLKAIDGKSIVGVHKGVNKVVHSSKPKTTAGLVVKRVPAEEKDSDVMEPVEEDDFLLANNEENGVHKLEELGVDEESDKDTVPSFEIPERIFADGGAESLVDELVVQSRDKEVGTKQRKDSEEKIPTHKKTLTLDRLGDPFLGVEDDIQVESNGQHGDFFVGTVELEETLSPSGGSDVVDIKHYSLVEKERCKKLNIKK